MIAIFSVIVLLIAGCEVYDRLPMYLRDEAVFKGYTARDGRDYSGKDLDIYYCYCYDEDDVAKFEESDLYKKVDNAIDIVNLQKLIRNFEEYSNVQNFSNAVTVGDYYILKCYDMDKSKTDEIFIDNYLIYFFDTDTQRLFYLRQTI